MVVFGRGGGSRAERGFDAAVFTTSMEELLRLSDAPVSHLQSARNMLKSVDLLPFVTARAVVWSHPKTLTETNFM